jgi:C2H2 type zinc finger protein
MAVRCATCDEMFETPELLSVHTEEAHGAEDGRSEGDDVASAWKPEIPEGDAESVGERFDCSICGVELSSRDSLQTHLHDAHAA